MAEYELNNINHNMFGDPHPQYDFNEIYTSKYSGNQTGARVKLMEVPLCLDVTSMLSSDYYGYKGVRRLNVGFKITDTVSENSSLVGDAFISAYVRGGNNDDISFQDDDNFRGFGTIDWHTAGDYRTPIAVDARLEVSMFVTKDPSYKDINGISRYILSVYASMHRYGSVSIQPTHLSWDISRKTSDSGVKDTPGWSMFNPFGNPWSNTKEKYDWLFSGLRTNPVISKTDFEAMAGASTNVRIPVIQPNGLMILDSYSSIDVKAITKLLHLPVGNRYKVEIRNSTIANGPSTETDKWAFCDIIYTNAQRTISLYYLNNNAYRITENGYNTGSWSSWKSI